MLKRGLQVLISQWLCVRGSVDCLTFLWQASVVHLIFILGNQEVPLKEEQCHVADFRLLLPQSVLLGGLWPPGALLMSAPPSEFFPFLPGFPTGVPPPTGTYQLEAGSLHHHWTQLSLRGSRRFMVDQLSPRISIFSQSCKIIIFTYLHNT